MTAIISRAKPRAALLVSDYHRGVVALTIASVADSRPLVSYEQLIPLVRDGAAQSVIVSGSAILNGARSPIAEMARRFPDVAVVGWMDVVQPDLVIEAARRFGEVGAKSIVRADGKLHDLRRCVADVVAADPFIASALRQLQDAGDTEGWKRFVATMFHEDVSSAIELGEAVGVRHQTVASRFFRRRLPAPKRWLALVRLVAAARILENPRASVEDVAYRLGHGSPQAFGRHVQGMLGKGMTAARFRAKHDGASMLRRALDELVAPHRDRLLGFDPLESVR